VLVLSIIWLHQIRVRRHEAQNQRLEALVADRTEHLENAIKSMETLTYSMAHDLRGPLRTIRGMTTALLDEYRAGFDETAFDYSRRIKQAVGRMEDMVQHLLVYGLIAHSKAPIEKVSLDKIFELVLAELQAEIQARKAIIELTRPQPEIMANALLLQQVLTNLVSNGVKFVPPTTPPRLHIWSERQRQTVKICVQDNGIGIEPMYQRRIFGLFERLHGQSEFPGSGVGLAIVQKGVERMGGKVGVESQPGKGSCFWLELPAAK
jgi:signal transduction histidine kinase